VHCLHWQKSWENLKKNTANFPQFSQNENLICTTCTDKNHEKMWRWRQKIVPNFLKMRICRIIRQFWQFSVFFSWFSNYFCQCRYSKKSMSACLMAASLWEEVIVCVGGGIPRNDSTLTHKTTKNYPPPKRQTIASDPQKW